jgi:hypothetical protein
MLVAGAVAARSGFLESYAIQIILEAGCGCGAVQLVSGLLGRTLRCRRGASGQARAAVGCSAVCSSSISPSLPLLRNQHGWFCAGMALFVC